MWHVVIEWAGSDSEMADFETEEDAEKFLKDAIGSGTNSRGYIWDD